jgi:hypothetical protein
VTLRPADPLFLKNHAMARLQAGDYAVGWRDWEWRLQTPQGRLRFDGPAWDGGPLEGRTLLVQALEQGFGDALQFLRFLPEARRRAGEGRVVVSVHSALAPLIGGMADEICVDDQTPPDCDLQVSLFSLPHLFGVELDDLPGPTPYLRADPERVAVWKTRLEGLAGLRVGIAWRGNPTRLNDRPRSLTAELVAPIVATPGVSFVSLLKDGRPEEFVGLGGRVLDVAEMLSDFGETAALMMNVDLVITSDTSVCHLAGALGRQTWTMISHAPDWRWLLGREDSPWYPTMRLFRQPALGDWPAVIDRVREELAAIAGGGG